MYKAHLQTLAVGAVLLIAVDCCSDAFQPFFSLLQDTLFIIL